MTGISTIVEEVGKFYGLSPQRISGSGVDHKTTKARHLVMYLAYQVMNLKGREVIAHFGCCAGILVYAASQTRKRMAADKDFAGVVESMSAMLAAEVLRRKQLRNVKL